MLISVITVCYNAEDTIGSTIESLKNQTYTDFEYLIIDGASKDNTLNIAKSLTMSMANVKIISESDNGIYDAMNKGIRHSSGEYIYFLNAGDTLYDSKVFDKVTDVIKTGKKNFYYGNVMYGNEPAVYTGKLNNLFF